MVINKIKIKILKQYRPVRRDKPLQQQSKARPG